MGDCDYTSTLFAFPFSGVTLSSTVSATAYDLWSVKASSLGRVVLEEINLGQRTTAAGGAVQLDIQLLRGTSANASPGATIAGVNTKGWATAPTALTSATGPSSNLASTTNASLLYADNTDLSGNWNYRPDDYEEFTLDSSQGFTLRISPPVTNVAVSGTLLLREIGKLK